MPQDLSELPGYEDLAAELSTLIAGCPPPFIYINDPESFEVTIHVLRSLLRKLSVEGNEDADVPAIRYGYTDAVCCLSQRSLYESLLHSLVDFEPSWDDKCTIWTAPGDLKWNDNMDSFLQGLRLAHAILSKKLEGPCKRLRFVLVIKGAERLKDNLPDIFVPLTRLHELSQIDITVVFVSQVGWDAVKPSLTAAADPYFIDVPPLSKEAIAQILISRFSDIHEKHPTSPLYHPALQALYAQYATVICDVCYLFTHDPQELQYIAAARWPGFVEPVLDDHRRKVEELGDGSDDGEIELPPFEPPSEENRLRLIRMFTPTFTLAVEALYPRLTNAADWAKENDHGAKIKADAIPNPLSHLSRLSKFILIASFVASTNPAKSDLRMFGRGADEKKRRRRATRAANLKGGVSKIPQRLQGPSPFPLDRLIAIVGSLLEEHDADERIPAPEFDFPGEYTDMEISRLALHSSVLELTSSRLLYRTTKPDQIDGPPMFKAATSFDTTMSLAKELGIQLHDLLWETV